jgi:hypothetical protein
MLATVKGSGDPKLFAIDQGSGNVGDEGGHLRRHAGSAGALELIPIGQHQKTGDRGESQRDGENLPVGHAGEKREEEDEQDFDPFRRE